MKKLLGVIGIVALAAALLPAQGYADLRGAFAPLTSQSGFGVTGTEQAAIRPVDADGIMLFPADAGGRLIEAWFAFSSRSLIPGHETVRSIFLHLSAQQSGYFAALLDDPITDPDTVVPKVHPQSYFDPAWSADGRFLAYVRTDFGGENQTMFVQEYFVNDDFEATTCSPGGCGSYPDGEGSDSPIGDPIIVTTTGQARHPNWSPTGHTLAYDANDAGSYDIYTVDIDVDAGTVGTPIRRTFEDNKSETDPSWGPIGQKIAYVTNKFGPKIIEIIDLSVPPGPGYTTSAERNFALLTHGNPDWTSDGASIMYDAPSGEDPSAVTNLWKLDLATQAKCEIQFDVRADADADVSGIVNHTRPSDGNVPFNYFFFTSQAANIGLGIWKGNPINSCLLPLAMGVATIPPVIDLADEDTEEFEVILNFPPETRALGYRCQSTNAGSIDGVRLRVSLLASPTVLGQPSSVGGGVQGTGCVDVNTHTAPDSLKIHCDWDRRDIAERIQDLGLVNQIVPLKVQAYSNILGRGFQGFAYLRLTDNSIPTPVAILGSSPNPFNPLTRIKFAVNKPGNYALRLYNVQGALIRTVASRHFDAGTHEATWDGRTNNGGMAASGVYYAKISGAAKKDGSEGFKLVLAK